MLIWMATSIHLIMTEPIKIVVIILTSYHNWWLLQQLIVETVEIIKTIPDYEEQKDLNSGPVLEGPGTVM